jgi:hypothetical protein
LIVWTLANPTVQRGDIDIDNPHYF